MDQDKYFETDSITGGRQRIIAAETAKALRVFCRQEPEFEQAVEQSGKTFQQCLDSICKKIGEGISDLEVYTKAVKFYFSTATVHFNMTIDLSGDNGHADPPITVTQSKHESSLGISLDELLDF